MLGKHYIIEHCISYIGQKAKDEALRSYIADALHAIANNTSHLREGGMKMSARFSEIFNDETPSGESGDEEVTAQEVVDNIKQKLRNLKGRGKSHGLDDGNGQAGD